MASPAVAGVRRPHCRVRRTALQVSEYYLDLVDPRFISYMAIVHSRFSSERRPPVPVGECEGGQGVHRLQQ